MIENIFKLLKADNLEGKSKIVDIALGKYAIPTTIRQVKNKRKMLN